MTMAIDQGLEEGGGERGGGGGGKEKVIAHRIGRQIGFDRGSYFDLKSPTDVAGAWPVISARLRRSRFRAG